MTPRLEPLRAEHLQPLLAFELENREFFGRVIEDRGDAFYEHFPDRHAEMLAEQESGEHRFHVLVDETGAVLGRFNLYWVKGGAPELGYRMAQQATGRGFATAAVRELCGLARERYGTDLIRAKIALANIASERVALNAGFEPAGPARVRGRPGTWYEKRLGGA